MNDETVGPQGPRGRGRRLIRPLQAATGIAVVASLVALIVPGPPGRWAGGAVVALLIGTPVVRIVFMGGRWWQIGDRRFTAVAALLVAVLAAASVIGWGR